MYYTGAIQGFAGRQPIGHANAKLYNFDISILCLWICTYVFVQNSFRNILLVFYLQWYWLWMYCLQLNCWNKHTYLLLTRYQVLRALLMILPPFFSIYINDCLSSVNARPQCWYFPTKAWLHMYLHAYGYHSVHVTCIICYIYCKYSLGNSVCFGLNCDDKSYDDPWCYLTSKLNIGWAI